MQTTRALVAAFLAVLGLAFFALLSRAIYEGVALGELTETTMSLLVVAGFFIVATVFVVAGRGRLAQISLSQCPVCGSPVYATVRAFDRRRQLTCFTCGYEAPKVGV